MFLDLLRQGPEDPQRSPSATGTGSSGRGGQAGLARAASPVSDRTIEYDLKFLIAVFNWAGEVEGRAWPPVAWTRIPLRGPEDAHGEEPGPGRPF